MSAGTSELFCLICLLVCSCTAQTNITAKHGQDVILPCKAPDNKITVVEWIRPGLDPDHVLLYRNGRLDPHSQHPSYQNRVDLQDKEMKDGNVSLILKNVTMEDTGKYVCRVSQKGKTEPFSIIYLKVYLSAQEIITAERGQNVILPCKAPDNNNINDITAVQWSRPDQDPDYVLVYRDGHFDPDNQHPSYQNRVDLQDKEMKDGDFSLNLKKVTMEDRGTYECLVDQSGKVELISIINLEVYDHSRTTLGIVGFVVGVLVCLLSAAAVIIYRQYRKRKTLERTNQHLEKINSDISKQLEEEKQKNEILNSRLEKWTETGRTLKNRIQNSIQNINKELKKMNCCTNSDPTESDEENQQQKLEKLQDENQKLKMIVENQKKELQNMNQKLNEMSCDTNSDPTESDEENPQEEDENQKLMETGRNLQTELQNMNQELELEGPITLEVVDGHNHFISLQNKSSEEIELEGWKLQLQRNNREPDIYTFKESDRIQAGRILCMGHTNWSEHPQDVNLKWSELEKWNPGDKLQINLKSNKGKTFKLL